LNRGFQVVALSGELSQAERSHALQAMRDGRARVCVATDVAARGIDLPGLELVVHADLPMNREGLLHRSGRTGRAGAKGVAALIVPFSARRKAERLLASANVAPVWASAPSAEEVSARDVERLLSEPLLTTPATGDEAPLVARLMQTYDAEALAVAVVRQYMAQRSAPEDLAAVSPDGAKPRARVEFEESQWFSLTIGQERRADPRWLLPMLCRAGDLSRRDIGAIRVQETRTLVQIHADAGPRFIAALGAGMQLEDGIAVSKLDQAPVGTESHSAPRVSEGRGPVPAAPRSYGAKKTFSEPAQERKPYEKPARAKPFGEKPYGGKSAPETMRPAAREAVEVPRPVEKPSAPAVPATDAPAKKMHRKGAAAYDPLNAPSRPVKLRARDAGEGDASVKERGAGWAKPKPKAKAAGKPGAKFGKPGKPKN